MTELELLNKLKDYTITYQNQIDVNDVSTFSNMNRGWITTHDTLRVRHRFSCAYFILPHNTIADIDRRIRVLTYVAPRVVEPEPEPEPIVEPKPEPEPIVKK